VPVHAIGLSALAELPGDKLLDVAIERAEQVYLDGGATRIASNNRFGRPL
jgi:hypothetical protein